ncbi:MAG TPA: EthD family reductase [Chitinophagaceae bacterium]|nr:EthD family reductase [Chitinophagaceae bacterium]
MVQLNIHYPKTAGAHFDWDYYLNIHMPLSIKLQGAALKSVTISKGIEGVETTPVAYVALTTLLYDSVDAFLKAFLPHAETLQGDMKNYTTIQPVMQFSEVVMQVKEA